MPDVLGAVHDFVRAHIVPQPEHIVRGLQNRAALPAASAYAVLTLTGAARRGTNVHDWSPAAAEDAVVQTVSMLVVYDVQADFCGPDEALVGRQAAQLVMLGRDATRFFEPYGLSCLYADDPRFLPFGDDLDQWKVRYAVTLHLSARIEAAGLLPAFGRVNLFLENVDVHHPVRGA